MKLVFFIVAVLLTAISVIGQNARQFVKNGLTKYDQQDYTGAMFDFMKAIEKNPKSAEAYYHMGLTRRALNHEINSMDKTVITRAYSSGISLSETGKGSITCQLTDYKQNLDSLNEVIKFNPNNPKAYFTRGVAKGGLNDFKGAIEDYSAALALNPGYPEGYLFRGIAKECLKDYNGAIADLTIAIELSPKSGTAYRVRSAAKMSIHDKTGSEADLAKALEVDPANTSVIFSLDGSTTTPGHSLEIDDYTMAIKLNPRYADAYYERGLARIKLEQKDEGCLDLTKAAGLGFQPAQVKINEYCR